MSADRFDWQPDKARMLMDMRMEFGLSLLTRKVVESDPADWPQQPVTVHGWRDIPRALWRSLRNHARRSRQIVGYEYRKAAGRQRRYTDPKSMAIVTGITS